MPPCCAGGTAVLCGHDNIDGRGSRGWSGPLGGAGAGGEQIQICQGDAVVELRATQPTQSGIKEALSPREALRLMQEESRLTPEQAEQYLREVREERVTAEARVSA